MRSNVPWIGNYSASAASGSMRVVEATLSGIDEGCIQGISSIQENTGWERPGVAGVNTYHVYYCFAEGHVQDFDTPGPQFLFQVTQS